jgi:hypothetical protein
LQQLLTEEHANSRFIYLVTNLTVCVCVLALVATAIWKGVPSNALILDAYIYLVGVLLSGGVAGAAGRWMTNRKTTPPTMESTEKTTVTEKTITK